MKKTVAALVAILIAGIGLFFAYNDKDTEKGAPATGNTTLAELWANEEFGQPEKTEQPQKTTKTTTTKATGKGGFFGLFAPKEKTTKPEQTTVTAKTTTTAEDPEARYAFAGVYEGIAPRVAETPADKYLLCVNREYALPKGHSGTVKLALLPEDKHQMEVGAAAQFRKMYEAGRAAGVTLSPFSAFRNTERQKKNFEDKINSWVNAGKTRKDAVATASQSILPPGCSEHEAGLAIDIVSTYESFDQSKEFRWLMDNAQEYGFILRYPKDKASITQVKYEPWHWRYVGVEHAKKIKASGQCLEEYLEMD